MEKVKAFFVTRSYDLGVERDGEMPQTPPAHVKFTRKSRFGLKKTYKTGSGRMNWINYEAGSISAVGLSRCSDQSAFLAGKYSRASG